MYPHLIQMFGVFASRSKVIVRLEFVFVFLEIAVDAIE